MEIFWTLTAKDTFKSNIRYLLEDWTYKEVIKFSNEVYKKLDLLATHPNLGRFDDDLKCYKYLIVKQITLLYLIDGDKIYLLNFWNNYKKPLDKLL